MRVLNLISFFMFFSNRSFKWVRASARNLGAGLCPAQCVWQGSGFAADQTNAMLATSNGGDKSSRKRKPLRLFGAASFAEEFSIYSRETRCLSIWVQRIFLLAHSVILAFLHGGGITTLSARFMPPKRWTPAGHGGLFAVFMPLRCSSCVG